MAKIDLTGLSYAELKEHLEEVEAALVAAKETSRRAALAAVHKVASEHGFALHELDTRTAPKPDKPAPVAKYRDLKDTWRTWSGRGRKPAWVQRHLDKGKKLEELLIS